MLLVWRLMSVTLTALITKCNFYCSKVAACLRTTFVLRKGRTDMIMLLPCRAFEEQAGGVYTSAEDCPCGEAAREKGPHHSKASWCQYCASWSSHLPWCTLWENAHANNTQVKVSILIIPGDLLRHFRVGGLNVCAFSASNTVNNLILQYSNTKVFTTAVNVYIYTHTHTIFTCPYFVIRDYFILRVLLNVLVLCAAYEYIKTT